MASLVATMVPNGTQAATLRPASQQGRVNYRIATVKAKLACASLGGRVLDAVSTIASATDIAATAGVPAHCEVVVASKKTLHIAIDLPPAWNQRDYVLGNGGFGGGSVVAPGAIAGRSAVLVNGFAVASNDAGEPDASFADPNYASFLQTNPEGMVDYSYRAVHLSALYVKPQQRRISSAVPTADAKA